MKHYHTCVVLLRNIIFLFYKIGNHCLATQRLKYLFRFVKIKPSYENVLQFLLVVSSSGKSLGNSEVKLEKVVLQLSFKRTLKMGTVGVLAIAADSIFSRYGQAKYKNVFGQAR